MNHIKVGVGVLIWKEGKLLLGKRLSRHGHADWSFPGGHLEFSETPENAAIRETKEETDIVVTKLEKFHFTNDVFDSSTHYVTLFFLAKSWYGEIQNMEPHKCLEWNWFSPIDLPAPLFQPIKALLLEKTFEAPGESDYLDGSGN